MAKEAKAAGAAGAAANKPDMATIIQDAMAKAVTDAQAEGITDPEKVRDRMMAARKAAIEGAAKKK